MFNQLQDESADYEVIQRAVSFIRHDLYPELLPSLIKKNPKVEDYFVTEAKKVCVFLCVRLCARVCESLCAHVESCVCV